MWHSIKDGEADMVFNKPTCFGHGVNYDVAAGLQYYGRNLPSGMMGRWVRHPPSRSANNSLHRRRENSSRNRLTFSLLLLDSSLWEVLFSQPETTCCFKSWWFLSNLLLRGKKITSLSLTLLPSTSSLPPLYVPYLPFLSVVICALPIPRILLLIIPLSSPFSSLPFPLSAPVHHHPSPSCPRHLHDHLLPWFAHS